jgi:hypothetical protein
MIQEILKSFFQGTRNSVCVDQIFTHKSFGRNNENEQVSDQLLVAKIMAKNQIKETNERGNNLRKKC